MITNVLEYLDDIVKVCPDKLAYADSKTEYTFKDVEKNSKAIGTFLNDKGLYKEPVIIFMKKSPKTIASFFGAVYAGCYYIPIDEEMPKQRLNMIFETLNAKAMIVDDESIEKAQTFEMFNGEIYKYDDITSTSINQEALDVVRGKHLDTDILYILFTSGSTGRPKGVVLSHRQILDYTETLGEVLELSQDTVFGNQTPLYFDASLKELYGTIKHGCTTWLIEKQLFMFPVKLVEYLNEHKVNTITWASSALVIISSFNTFEKVIPEYLHTVAFSTEVFPTKQYNIWKSTLPHVRFFNMYGPTEATGVCTYHEVVEQYEDNENIPIGKPFRNTEILLLKEDGTLATGDESGEICVKGACLALGYFKDEKKTAEAFVQNPLNDMYPEVIYKTGDLGKYNENGNIVFVSRKDYQIKHMGHRIELGEIEQNVNSLEGIQSCCCVYNDIKERIVLYYVGTITKKEIIAELKERIPRYMIPNSTYQLEALPMNINDKIDRVLLKQMAMEPKKKERA